MQMGETNRWIERKFTDVLSLIFRDGWLNARAYAACVLTCRAWRVVGHMRAIRRSVSMTYWKRRQCRVRWEWEWESCWACHAMFPTRSKLFAHLWAAKHMRAKCWTCDAVFLSFGARLMHHRETGHESIEGSWNTLNKLDRETAAVMAIVRPLNSPLAALVRTLSRTAPRDDDRARSNLVRLACTFGDVVDVREVCETLDIARSETSCAWWWYDALHAACCALRIDVIAYLHAAFAVDPNQVACVAAECGRLVIVEWAYWNWNWWPNTIFWADVFGAACENGHLNVALYVADQCGITERDVAVEDMRSETTLMMRVCRDGHTNVAEWLCERFDLPRCRVIYGTLLGRWNSLHFACEAGDEDIMRFFHERYNWTTEEMRTTDKYDNSPLDLALMSRNEALVRWMLDTFAWEAGDVNATHLYSCMESVSFVRHVHDQFPDMKWSSEESCACALRQLCCLCPVDTVRLFCEKFCITTSCVARQTYEDCEYFTVLSSACLFKNEPVAHYLWNTFDLTYEDAAWPQWRWNNAMSIAQHFGWHRLVRSFGARARAGGS
jgi:hypothetical protein